VSNGSAPAPTAEHQLPPGFWKIAAVVILGPFMTSLDSTVVNVSLSKLTTELSSTIATAQWVMSGYLLALALMLPLNAWLVHRLGTKKLYIICFIFFTLTSFLCGAAQTMHQLIFFRVLQGMAGGLLAPMAQLMIAQLAGPNLARVLGYTVMPILVAPILGPVLAGGVLKYASWRWLFYLNLPVGVLSVILSFILLPKDTKSSKARPLDFIGLLLLSPGLALLIYGLDLLGKSHQSWAFLLSLPMLMSFIFHARKKGDQALIDLDLFKIKVFSTAAINQFLANGVVYAGQMLIPLLLIQVGGFTPSEVGFIIMPMGIGMMMSYPMMGYLTDRFGYRAVSAGGAILGLLGTLPFLFMLETHVSVLIASVSVLIRGAGTGGVSVPSISAAYASVPRDKLPIATTSINIVQRMGGPVATTVAAILMDRAMPHEIGNSGLAHVPAFEIAFAFLILVQTLNVIAALNLPERVNGRIAPK
jgi:EmrB/QacA subfamily drug resistance transporter